VLEKSQKSPAVIFFDFLLIGIQSFGGGSSTFSLIHQAAIRRGWLSEQEFVRAWSLVQISPGINLVKLTVMIGYRLHGWLGILAAVSGLLLPSSIVTVLMTAGFTTVRNIVWVQALMKGIIPAAIGLSFAMGVQMAQPIFLSAQKDGPGRVAAHIFLLVGSVGLMAYTQLSPLLILMISGIASLVLFLLIPARSSVNSSGKSS
jgi:chromate transporter